MCIYIYICLYVEAQEYRILLRTALKSPIYVYLSPGPGRFLSSEYIISYYESCHPKDAGSNASDVGDPEDAGSNASDAEDLCVCEYIYIYIYIYIYTLYI